MAARNGNGTAKPTLVITFEKERDTKNTVRYQEAPGAEGIAFIGTLYVQKAAGIKFGSMPESLKVTIQPGD